MVKIHKYTLKSPDHGEVDMPKGAKILDIQAQGDAVVIWVLENASNDREQRQFKVFGTNEEVPNAHKLRHLKTIQFLQKNQVLAVHLFEVLKF